MNKNIISSYISYETPIEHSRLFITYKLEKYRKAVNDNRNYVRNSKFIKQKSHLLEVNDNKDDKSSFTKTDNEFINENDDNISNNENGETNDTEENISFINTEDATNLTCFNGRKKQNKQLIIEYGESYCIEFLMLVTFKMLFFGMDN